MNERDLFSLALGIVSPWFIVNTEFNVKDKRLDLYLDFKKGSHFCCPECGASSPVHDTTKRTWRHLDFFQHHAFLTARVPRTKCAKCGVKQVLLPWARPDSGFTLLFEALLLRLAMEMPVDAVATLASVDDMFIWRMLDHYVDRGVLDQDISKVTAIGIDECSKQKGQQYITTFCDLDKSRVIYVAEGRSTDTVDKFGEHLDNKGVPREQIKEVCVDMWQAYFSGVEKNLPNAKVTFDRYHVMTYINKAVDETRRQEIKENPILKDTRYLWLKNPDNLTEKQKIKLSIVKSQDLKTVRAYHIKLSFQKLWEIETLYAAKKYLEGCLSWASHSKLEAFAEVTGLIKRHMDGILRYLESRISNGVVEGVNSKIKTAVKRAYGFKSFSYYKTTIYLVAGKLKLQKFCQAL